MFNPLQPDFDKEIEKERRKAIFAIRKSNLFLNFHELF